MPAGSRLLWTGPYAADLRGLAIARGGPEVSGLWIVATAMARDELLAELTRSRAAPDRPRVVCWDDLWAEVARHHHRSPLRFSDASARAAVVAAIGRARDERGLGPLLRVADLPGMRKALRDHFAAWTTAERPTSGGPPREDDVAVAEWAVFRHYRAILAEHGAEDGPGLAVWASKAIADGPLGRPEAVTILDPVAPTRPERRVIDWAARVAGSVLVTLPTLDDPDNLALGPLWETLTEAGFEEVEYEPEPRGLARLELTLFDLETHRAPLGPIPDLSILGAPRGEGMALVLAREVARRVEAGARPDDMAVLVRRWDDDGSLAQEVLRRWGLPVSGGPARPLATEPAVAALRLALSIPVEGWQTVSLIRLLRNGQVRLPWADLAARADAASVLQSLRVFRGRKEIAARLDEPEDDKFAAERSLRARRLIDRLGAILDGPAEPATWPEQARRLRTLASRLGLGSAPADRSAIEAFWDAIDDHALIRDHDRPIGRSAFARAVESIARDVPGPAPARVPGTVVFATVDEASGIRPRVAFLTNLAEGSFPTRESVAVDPDADPPVGEPFAFSVERLRFLRALGSAREEAVLLVPTTDDKGQDLLPAGFVDDVRRRLGDVADDPRHAVLSRLDPVFREHPGLARSPADARVHAVALACLDREVAALRSLARRPEHRASLAGTAAGLRLVHERLRVRSFTAYDGLLSDPRIVERIAEAFGPDHAFSPSQIESFALCPFQFYQRYVLNLKPVDDRPELRVDHARQGQDLHEILEAIHGAIASEGGGVEPLGRLEAHLAGRLEADPDREADEWEGPRRVEDGLRAIDGARVRRILGRYRNEFSKYRERDDEDASPERFEVGFGLEDDDSAYPLIVLGAADHAVRLRGKIDRVDLVRTRAGPGFRVIDYKLGYAPSGPEVTKSLLAVQLPLYALAVEQYLFGETPAASCDFGYWALGRDGFRPVKLGKGESWPDFRDRVVDEVLRLAALLRMGNFPIRPQKPQCQRSCDYKIVCRIGQVRDVEKEVVTITLMSREIAHGEPSGSVISPGEATPTGGISSDARRT